MISLLGTLLGFSTSIIPEVLGYFKQRQANEQVNGLRGSVRPVITYLFFALFAGVKVTLIYALIANQNVEWTVAIQTAWDQDTAAIFSAIMAFWFGNRAMSKARASRNQSSDK